MENSLNSKNSDLDRRQRVLEAQVTILKERMRVGFRKERGTLHNYSVSTVSKNFSHKVEPKILEKKQEEEPGTEKEDDEVKSQSK